MHLHIQPPSFSLGLTQDFPIYNATPLNHQSNEEEGLNQNFTTNTTCPLDQPTHEEGEEKRHEDEVHHKGEGAKDGEKNKTPKNRGNRLPGIEFRSPYIVRCLNPKSLPTKKETEFAAYVISSVETPLTYRFKYEDILTRNEDLQSLVTNDSFLDANVISTYCFMLSYRERYKDKSSPSRVFFPIEVTTKLAGFDDYEKSYNTFMGDMDIYFRKWSTYFIKPRYDILDNNSEGGSSLEKYSDLPSKLKEFLTKWLISKNALIKASLARSLEIVRSEMKWCDQSNDCDCAIYMLRHMETYKGDLKEWDTGLQKGQFKALQNLRIKYAYDIVSFQENELQVANVVKRNY